MATISNKSTKWKEVTIGGVSGILIGSASTMFANDIRSTKIAEEVPVADEASEGQQEQDVSPTTQNEEVAIPNDGAVATSVNDNMNFNEAFAAARSELGAGGYFVWHGNVYGTYYPSEWNSMSEEQQNLFSSGTTHVPHHSNNSHHVNTSSNSFTDNVGSNQVTDEDDNLDFQVLGVEHANLDGEHESVIGLASVGGQAVYFIDVDGQDDEFEYMATDLNGNTQLDEDEFVDISQQHMSVSSFEQLAHENNAGNEIDQYYAENDNLPDYVNDADTGDLA